MMSCSSQSLVNTLPSSKTPMFTSHDNRDITDHDDRVVGILCHSDPSKCHLGLCNVSDKSMTSMIRKGLQPKVRIIQDLSR